MSIRLFGTPRPSISGLGNLIRGLFAACLLGPALGNPPIIAGQPAPPIVAINGTPCGGCSVRVVLDHTIDGKRTPLADRPGAMARDSRGRLFISSSLGSHPPLIFDSTGRFLREFGKRGLGPGEIPSVSAILIGAGDSISVYTKPGAVIVFSRDLEYSHSKPMLSSERGTYGLARLRGGFVASLNEFYLPDQADLAPIALRDSRGRLVRELRPRPSPSYPTKPSRRLAPASTRWDAFLWVAESHYKSAGYDIMLVDSVGRIRRTFERRPEWWTTKAPRATMLVNSDTIPKPNSSLAGIREDGSGRLLALTREPRADWKAVRNEDHMQAGNYVAVLEVLDPRTATFIGSARVRGHAHSILSDDRFATYREDVDGIPYLDVWKIVVR